jgi:hypothetical protein
MTLLVVAELLYSTKFDGMKWENGGRGIVCYKLNIVSEANKAGFKLPSGLNCCVQRKLGYRREQGAPTSLLSIHTFSSRETWCSGATDCVAAGLDAVIGL